MEFEKDGLTHYVKRIPHECRERFYNRVEFIGELFPKWNEDYATLIQYSKIWSSIKYDGTRYADVIENSIKKMTSGTKYELSF